MGNFKVFLLNIFKTKSHTQNTSTTLDLRKFNDLYEDVNEFKKDYAHTVKNLVELQRKYDDFHREEYKHNVACISENAMKIKDFGYKLDMTRGMVEDLKIKFNSKRMTK